MSGHDEAVLAPGSLCALSDALSELAACVFSASSGEPAQAAEFLMEASVASADAFPLGSAESEALGVLLDYARRVMDGDVT